MVYRACRVYGIIGIVGIIGFAGFRVRELKCSRPSPFHRRQGGMTIRRHRWGEEGGAAGAKPYIKPHAKQKILVRFSVPSIIRHLLSRVPKQGP